ncbi:MAG: S8 family serine peptidase, partial [Nitriliruptoraceae bacterium]
LLDAGVDLAHPDLSGAFWRNPGEEADGRDNDGNGIVDDIAGWDVLRNTGIDPDRPETSPAEPHGTQVAGVIAAQARDGVGIAGLAPNVRLMVLRAFEQDPTSQAVGRSDIATLVAAIDYAVANGADVLNASWESPTDSEVLERAVAEAGIPVVAAAGNRGLDLDLAGTALPASAILPNLVAVTAIDPAGRVPRFANLGAGTIDLGAPGLGIVTTAPGGTYTSLSSGTVSGTSFATPFVSGAVALGRSLAPTTSVPDLLDVLLRTTVAHEPLAGRTTTGGRLDVGAFLAGLERPVCGADDLPVAGFVDVEVTSAHARAIDCVAAVGVATGYPDGTFRPDQDVTRGQLASLLAGMLRAAGIDPTAADDASSGDDAEEGTGDAAEGTDDADDDGEAGSGVEVVDAFPDDDGSVHESAIDVLAALGVLQGGADGRIDHTAPVTRGQLAALVTRTVELIDGEERASSRSWFPDAVGTTHEDAIGVARDLGIVRGRDRVTYDPAATTRRDQLASTLARALDALGRADVDLAVPDPAALATAGAG